MLSITAKVRKGYRISKEAANDYASWYARRKTRVITEKDILKAARKQTCVLHKHFFSKPAAKRFVKMGMWRFANDLLNGVQVYIVKREQHGPSTVKEVTAFSLLREDVEIIPISRKEKEQISKGSRVHVPADMVYGNEEVAEAVIRRAYQDFMRWKGIYEAILEKFGSRLRCSVLKVERDLQNLVSAVSV